MLHLANWRLVHSPLFRLNFGRQGWQGSQPAPLQRHSLWLQSSPLQPAGQSQPVPSALHVPPFWQSSHVRLQSGPKVFSRQTATRGAVVRHHPQGCSSNAGSLGRETLMLQPPAKLTASVLCTGSVCTERVPDVCCRCAQHVWLILEAYKQKYTIYHCCEMPTKFF